MVTQYSLNSIIYGFRQYGKFSSKEIKQFLITILIIGFIIGFNDKRGTQAIDSYYIMFMIFSMAAAAFAMLFKMLIQRFFLYKFGYNPEYEYSINSLLIGIVIVFASEGYIWFLAPGHTFASLLQSERLGKWRYGLKHLEHARSLAFGVIGLVAFAIILKFFLTDSSVFLKHFINITLAIAFFSLLPAPECDGIYIFFGGYRWLWVFTLGLVIAAAVLIKFAQNPWVVLFGTIGLGIIAGIIAGWRWGDKAL